MGFLLDLALGRLTGDSPVVERHADTEADREAGEERAAIYQFDAGMTRAEAERKAGLQ